MQRVISGKEEANHDFIEQIIDIYKDEYLSNRGVDYITLGTKTQSAGKDRQGVGVLLRFFKQKLPDASSDEILEKFRLLFKHALLVPDKFLQDNMTLVIISSKINEIIQHIRNANKPKDIKYRGANQDVSKWERIFTKFKAEQLQTPRQITGSSELTGARNPQE